jgi:hypothetical protein
MVAERAIWRALQRQRCSKGSGRLADRNRAGPPQGGGASKAGHSDLG